MEVGWDGWNGWWVGGKPACSSASYLTILTSLDTTIGIAYPMTTKTEGSCTRASFPLVG